MFNTTTKRYELSDGSSNPYEWIFEGIELSPMTNDEIYRWVDALIEASKASDLMEVEERVATLNFPVMGYTTAQVFENETEYLEYKRNEIEENYATEREYVFNLIKERIVKTMPKRLHITLTAAQFVHDALEDVRRGGERRRSALEWEDDRQRLVDAMTDRVAQINWLDDQIRDIDQNYGDVRDYPSREVWARVALDFWLEATRSNHELPSWFDLTDETYMLKRLSE